MLPPPRAAPPPRRRATTRNPLLTLLPGLAYKRRDRAGVSGL